MRCACGFLVWVRFNAAWFWACWVLRLFGFRLGWVVGGVCVIWICRLVLYWSCIWVGGDGAGLGWGLWDLRFVV